MKVYVVLELWWDGRAFTTNTEEVFVYASEELALKHKDRLQSQIKEGDVFVQVGSKDVIFNED